MRMWGVDWKGKENIDTLKWLTCCMILSISLFDNLLNGFELDLTWRCLVGVSKTLCLF